MSAKPKRKDNRGLGCLVLLVIIGLVYWTSTQQTNSPAGRATQTARASRENAATAPAPNSMTQVAILAATAEAAGQPLRRAFEQLDGVTSVESANVLVIDEDRVSVDAELEAPQSIVDELLQVTQELVPGVSQFRVNINGDEQRISYLWEDGNNYWRPLDLTKGELQPTFEVVSLNLANNRASATNTPARLVTRAPLQATAVPATAQPSERPPSADVRDTNAQTYYAEGSINVRSCASTSCAVVTRLSAGEAITVTGETDGDRVESGNATWYRVVIDGETGYVYSGVVSINAPVSSSNVSGNSGAQTYTCPSNCDGAVSMGLTAQQAAACGLDRDGDGEACYGN